MDDIFEELYYQFVYLPKKDACPERTARWEPFFHGAPLDLVDAKDGLVYESFGLERDKVLGSRC